MSETTPVQTKVVTISEPTASSGPGTFSVKGTFTIATGVVPTVTSWALQGSTSAQIQATLVSVTPPSPGSTNWSYEFSHANLPEDHYGLFTRVVGVLNGSIVSDELSVKFYQVPLQSTKNVPAPSSVPIERTGGSGKIAWKTVFTPPASGTRKLTFRFELTPPTSKNCRVTLISWALNVTPTSTSLSAHGQIHPAVPDNATPPEHDFDHVLTSAGNHAVLIRVNVVTTTGTPGVVSTEDFYLAEWCTVK